MKVQRSTSKVQSPGVQLGPYPSFRLGTLNLGRRTRRRRAGLTLIEVMLALTILGLGLSALIASVYRCLGIVRQARTYQTARYLLARVELENPLQLEEEIEEGEETGDFEGGPAGYRWTRTIESVGNKEDRLFQVKTRVSWSERGKTSFEEVLTFLYVPQQQTGGSFIRRR